MTAPATFIGMPRVREDSDIANALPRHPRGYGITKRAKVPDAISKHEDSEVYWYVSIRWSTEALTDARG